MEKKKKLKMFLYIDIIVLLLLILYKGYLFIYETDFESENIENIKQIQKNVSGDEFSFAVVGNIENSIDIFDKKIIDKINNDQELDFIISVGDAVLNGSEDKYRILNESLKKLEIPYIIGIGDNEVLNNGDDRFYKHFGPFFFSFCLKDSYFIFLDTTGITSIPWQKEWLVKELEHSEDYKNKFVFMSKAPFQVIEDDMFNDDENYIAEKSYRDFLIETYTKYNITAVFMNGPELFDSKEIKGVKYYVTGGAGGGILSDTHNSFYHFMKVGVNPNEVSYSTVKQETPAKYAMTRRIENVWIFIHSFFYINFINFIIIIALLMFIAIFIYLKVSKEKNYYRDFESTDDIVIRDKLNIAMFTNNYLPFIGGVPISIQRLVKGLKKRGHNVFVFAPDYSDSSEDEHNIIRCKLLADLESKKFKFAISNVFSKEIEKEFSKLNIDVIHTHHPFWMGGKGLKLGYKYNLPTVFTYHTRLEKYAHYLPYFQLVFKNIISHEIIRRFSQKCDAIIAPTNTSKEYLENIGVSREKFILPTGVDFDNFIFSSNKDINYIKEKYKSNGEILLCSVSRLSQEKNIYFLLESIKYIRNHVSIPFKCLIIGDGSEREHIIEYIKREGLENIIILIGAIPSEEIPKYNMASDIFIFSSLSETQGMVILEAMAGGCPVVAVRSSGIDDTIRDNFNGFKTKEEVCDWANKVILLMEDKNLRDEFGKNAIEFANTFSINEMAEKMEEVYYKLIKKRKKKN
jgi:glycosyltransferase involved in cell wall biosynthesis